MNIKKCKKVWRNGKSALYLHSEIGTKPTRRRPDSLDRTTVKRGAIPHGAQSDNEPRNVYIN